MPVLLNYLLKLSVGLTVVFLFYQLVLRRLTFYNCNRWYLIAYTIACFFIPFINVDPLLHQNEWTGSAIVQLIPVVESRSSVVETTVNSAGVNYWNIAKLILAAGIVIMLSRLLLQFFSYRRMMKKAELISGDDLKIYQVNESIIPFSFGNSVFINRHLHTAKELEDIIRHEFVHAKQKHSLDIIWGELLCVFNWYNPFAWLLKKAIRQNLEFIADNKVVENGINKKQYQYLLLKVIGNNQFSIASHFNFSSLKKRIAMMNKTKSAKRQLLRMLFLLPATAVLLLSFRKHIPFSKVNDPEKDVKFGAIVYDVETQKPLAGVLIKDEITNETAYSDERGYFSFNFTALNRKVEKHLWMSKEGYQRHLASFAVSFNENTSEMGIIGIDGMQKGNPDVVCTDCVSALSLKDGDKIKTVDYSSANAAFLSYIGSKKTADMEPFDKQAHIVFFSDTIKVIYSDTVPDKKIPPPPAAPALPSQEQWIKSANKNVKSITVKNNLATINLQNGKTETYNLDNAEQKKNFENKYGKTPPPPPPPSPKSKPAKPAEPASYDLKDKKVTVTTKEGATTVYDLADPAQKSEFQKLYGNPNLATEKVKTLREVTVAGQPVVSTKGLHAVVVQEKPISTKPVAGVKLAGTDPHKPVIAEEVTIVEKPLNVSAELKEVNTVGRPITATVKTSKPVYKEDKAIVEEVVVVGKPQTPKTLTADVNLAFDERPAKESGVVNIGGLSMKDEQQYILVDGKEYIPKPGTKLKGKFRITFMDKEEAVKKYGEKAKNGAIIAETIK